MKAQKMVKYSLLLSTIINFFCFAGDEAGLQEYTKSTLVFPNGLHNGHDSEKDLRKKDREKLTKEYTMLIIAASDHNEHDKLGKLQQASDIANRLAQEQKRLKIIEKIQPQTKNYTLEKKQQGQCKRQKKADQWDINALDAKRRRNLLKLDNTELTIVEREKISGEQHLIVHRLRELYAKQPTNETAREKTEILGEQSLLLRNDIVIIAAKKTALDIEIGALAQRDTQKQQLAEDEKKLLEQFGIDEVPLRDSKLQELDNPTLPVQERVALIDKRIASATAFVAMYREHKDNVIAQENIVLLNQRLKLLTMLQKRTSSDTLNVKYIPLEGRSSTPIRLRNSATTIPTPKTDSLSASQPEIKKSTTDGQPPLPVELKTVTTQSAPAPLTKKEEPIVLAASTQLDEQQKIFEEEEKKIKGRLNVQDINAIQQNAHKQLLTLSADKRVAFITEELQKLSSLGVFYTSYAIDNKDAQQKIKIILEQVKTLEEYKALLQQNINPSSGQSSDCVLL